MRPDVRGLEGEGFDDPTATVWEQREREIRRPRLECANSGTAEIMGG
jgi:hypothetical protein